MQSMLYRPAPQLPATFSMMSRWRSIRWARAGAVALAACIAIATGCPRRGSQTLPELELAASPEPLAERDFRAARALREQGQSAEASQRFRAFLDTWPSDPLAPFARLELGKLALLADKPALAKKWFGQVAEARDPVLAERGRLYRAVAVGRLGDHQFALSELSPLVGRTVDPQETWLVLDTVASAQEALGDRLGALETRDRQLRGTLTAELRAQVENTVSKLIDSLASELELQRAYELLPHDGFAWPEVARQLLRQSHERGDRAKVADIARELDREGIALDDDLASLVLRAGRPEEADPGVIGAILPLSGRGRAVGEAALHGLLVASSASSDGSGDPVRLVYRDDGGDPTQAAQALEDLVTVHRAIAVIGPLSAAPAHAAAERARDLGVPIIVLNPDSSLTQQEGPVFRLLADPSEEARALIGAASREGATSYALLRPLNSYGDSMGRAFEQAIVAQRGHAVENLAYDPAATSFVKEAETIEKARPDAVVLVGGPTQIALMAPALAAKGLWSVAPGAKPPEGRSTLYLVPAAGFSPSLATTSRRYLQGAHFAVSFDPSRTPAFAESYRAQFRAEPNLFSAAAHDAYRIAEAALRTGVATRESLYDALLRARASETATPTDGFSSARGPRRPVQIEVLLGATFVQAD